MAELLPLDKAIAEVLARAMPLPSETVPLAEARGRVLAEPARAAVDLPPFASSAMDGFAVRSADTPGTLIVVERIAAGRPAGRTLAAGEAMGIATGGVVPDGADAVVPIEDVVDHDNSVEIPSDVVSTANVRPRGGDTAEGDDVVAAGTRLGAAQIGALAAAGVPEVRVARRPRAAVLATGTELRAPGESLGTPICRITIRVPPPASSSSTVTSVGGEVAFPSASDIDSVPPMMATWVCPNAMLLAASVSA